MELKIKKATEVHILGSNVIMKTFSVIVRILLIYPSQFPFTWNGNQIFFQRMIEFFLLQCMGNDVVFVLSNQNVCMTC